MKKYGFLEKSLESHLLQLANFKWQIFTALYHSRVTNVLSVSILAANMGAN